MTQPDIAIVDYQMGNLRSVQKAFESTGHRASITSQPEEIAAADKVVLPGVGACGDAISELTARNLLDPIREKIASGKPFLGICLGLQMLLDVSYEGGQHAGLGIIGGTVDRFPATPGFKVPHMGWNQVNIQLPGCPLLKDVPPDAYFYFVHSYYVNPIDQDAVWLTCDYMQPFCAAVWRENLFATQFHPEKSQKHGLQMLRNFAAL